MDCGLLVGGGGLLICGLLWCVGVIVIMVCRGVIVVMVWWFACSISEKRETEKEREKDKDGDAVYDEYFIVMFILFYCVES